MGFTHPTNAYDIGRWWVGAAADNGGVRTAAKVLFALAAVASIGAAAYSPTRDYLRERNRVRWETSAVARGDLVRRVQSSGKIEPVQKVTVGSFVSGPIEELNVDFNDPVEKDQVLARIDPRLFEAAVRRDRATLESRRAERDRVTALLQRALKDYARGKELRRSGAGNVSEQELDQLRFEVKSLEAQRKLARASIAEAEAAMETSLANLGYCEIRSPVDGVVIDRKIDPGQTLAAQFQTPELFVVAPDLRKTVHVFASVDEADIGLIQKADAEDRPVTFTVDAHPGETFGGTIEQIRVSSTEESNVVTYPVVIAAENPELKLLPGMTANITFEVDSIDGALRIPNAALRFFPEDAALVIEADRSLVDGSAWEDADGDKVDRDRRHVWRVDGERLQAVEVRVGMSDNRWTEVVKGDLEDGAALVVGRKER